MKEPESKKNLVDQVDPNRRSFVARLLGAAAFVPPLIATFSMDALTARASEPLNCNIDEGYVGPNQFQAYLSGPGTRANGVATFTITSPSNQPPSVCLAGVTYTLKLTKGASAVDGVIIFKGKCIVNLPIGTPAAINDYNGLCDLDELLDDLKSGHAIMQLVITSNGKEFTLSGSITPSVNSFIIELDPC